mgnify:FL=1
MPRKGKGQKIQTAKGQEYGAAAAQEEAQRNVPLPESIYNLMPQESRIAPGSMGDLLRRTEKPDQAVTQSPASTPTALPESPFSPNIARIIPILLPLANSPYVGNDTREIVNKLISMVPQKDVI